MSIKQNKAGFTLVELMIVVAIVGFLASLAVPNYYTYLAKAKQAEVSMNLASLHAAQQAYWAENGTYKATLCGKDGIGWQPGGYQQDRSSQNFHYTYGFNLPGSQEGTHYFIGKLNTGAEHLQKTLIEDDRFIAAAAGKLRKNGKIDIWVIDEARNIRHVQDGLA